MKYQIGTKFHSRYIAYDTDFDNLPFYGIIRRIDKNEFYHVSWVYHEKIKRDNFDDFYTEEKFKNIMDSMSNQKWTIETPVALPEELFEL